MIEFTKDLLSKKKNQNVIALIIFRGQYLNYFKFYKKKLKLLEGMK